MPFRRSSTYPYPPTFNGVKDAEKYAKDMYRALLENDSRGEEQSYRSGIFSSLTVDTNTLYVDPVNHFVGIGTTSITEKFQVVGGNIRIGNNYTIQGLPLIGNDAIVLAGIDTNNHLKLGSTNPAIRMFANSVEVVKINSSGIVLPDRQVENQTYGLYEGTVNLIRTFRPTGGDGYNIFIGNSGNNTMLPLGIGGGASYNFAAGELALSSNTSGSANVAIGRESLRYNTTGGRNVAAGYKALRLNTIGERNVACGVAALIANTEGVGNCGFGDESLRYNSTGDHNTAVGHWALWNFTTGDHNTAIGDMAVYGGGAEATSTGSFNVGCGAYSLYNCSGDRNVALGITAGYYETGSDKLFIDNATRADEADGRIKALIYGVFAATAANQTIRFNANATVSTGPDSDTGFYVGWEGGAPTGFRASILYLFCPSSGTYPGQCAVRYIRHSTTIWNVGIDSDGTSGMKSLDTDFGFDPAAGGSYPIAFSLAGDIRLSNNLGVGGKLFGTSATKTIAVTTGVAPASSPIDVFQIYSADITGGNAAPHVRTEAGHIVKLYSQAHIDTPAENTAANTAAITSILAALETNGLLLSA